MLGLRRSFAELFGFTGLRDVAARIAATPSIRDTSVRFLGNGNPIFISRNRHRPQHLRGRTNRRKAQRRHKAARS